tara:strand:+ start:489 stop:1049 length:561 start_codon:yes stop_codon:yes gene_type:complete
MKIYFFGGTFDPPHKGHMLIYQHCLNLCDKFIFIPAKLSPGKNKPLASCQQRLDMLQILLKKNGNKLKTIIDNYEISSKSEISYTIDTIIYLKNKYPKSDLNMVIGYDQYLSINKWKNHLNILDNVNIVCFNRNSTNSKENIIDLRCNISSSQIRSSIKTNKISNLDKYIDNDVLSYIIENNIYKN